MEWRAIEGCIDPQTGVATLKCLPAVFINLINAALIFVGVIALIIFIFAGIKLINSGGDPKKVGEAKKTMTYAVIGVVIIFMSFFIIRVISQVTGVDCLTKIGFECQK